MKKHNIFKVILLSILAVVVMTWIFPTASYSSEITIGDRSQLGIFDIAAYISQVLFPYFSYVILTVVAIGIFYGVSYRIPAYRALLDKIVWKFKGNESIFLILTMVLIAAIVSVSGLTFGILFVFPFVISIVLLMGYNKLVAASVTVGSTIVGILGTTLGTNTTYYIDYVLSTDVYSEIYTKIVLLIIGLIILIFNVLQYAKKTRNTTDKVVELVPFGKSASKVEVKDTEEKKEVVTAKKKVVTNEEKPKKEKTATKSSSKTKSKSSSKNTKSKKNTKTKAYDLKSKNDVVVAKKVNKKIKTWPYILVFDLMVLILMVSTFDWSGVFEVDWFDTALTAVEDFEISGFPIFYKLLGTSVGAFGTWSLSIEVPMFFLVMAGFLAFIYGLKFDQFLDGALEGIKKSIKPAIYMFLTYLIVIIVVYNQFPLIITQFFLELTNDFNVITMTIIMAISSIFNIENVYVAQSTLPYITSVITDTELYPLLGVICQSVYGLMMLVAPTSVILLGTLTYLDVSYGQWIKHIWKLFLQLLVVLVIVFLVLFLI